MIFFNHWKVDGHRFRYLKMVVSNIVVFPARRLIYNFSYIIYHIIYDIFHIIIAPLFTKNMIMMVFSQCTVNDMECGLWSFAVTHYHFLRQF